VIEHRGKACGEALARLRHDARCVGYAARQVVNVRRGAHNGEFHLIESLS